MSIKCIFARRKFLEYCDGLLRPGKKAQLQKHLESCRECSILLEKIKAGGNALEYLKSAPVEIPESFAERAIRNIISAAKKEKKKPRLSPRVAAFLGASAVMVLIFAALFAMKPWGPRSTQTIEEGSFYSEFKEASGTGGERRKTPEVTKRKSINAAPELKAPTPLVVPVAIRTKTNHNKDSIRNMLENLPERKEVAEKMTMGHSILYSRTYVKKIADAFSNIGVDGALIEAMISYATRSEPVLLPFYGEKALYEGKEAIIIVFAGPRRTGESTALTRCEVWVLEPSVFRVNPDSSLLLFHEQKF